MSAATAPEPEAPPETIDQKIERLKRELADAEADKVGDQIDHFAGEFLELVPDYRVGEGEPPTLEEMEAALSFIRDAWTRLEAWRAAAKAQAAATAAARPCLALPPLTITPEMRAGERRPPGAGSVYRSGKGWKWRVSRDGKLLGGKTWPTRAEAEAELALVNADPTFVPAPADRKRLVPTEKHTCSRCGRADHRAPACPHWMQERHEGAGGAGDDALAMPGQAPVPVAEAAPATPDREDILSPVTDGERAREPPNIPKNIPDSDAAPVPRAHRPDGAGTVMQNGSGWRWQVSRGGKKITSKTLPTKELAEESLEIFLKLEAEQAPSKAPGQARSGCGRCGAIGHNARTCPRAAPAEEEPPEDRELTEDADEDAEAEEAAPSPLPIPPPVVAPKPPPSAPHAPPVESNPRYIHPGRGWGPVDAGGFSNHEPCKGTGRIEHNDGKGKVSRVRCIPCNGEGARACLAKPKRSA